MNKEFYLNFNSLLEQASTTLSAEDFKNLFLSCCRNKFNLLNAAAQEGCLEILEAVLVHAKQMLTDGSLTEEECLEYLWHSNNYGFIPLNIAVRKGYLEIVQVLLAHAEQMFTDSRLKEKSAKYLLQCNNYGFTPLISSAKGGPQIVQLLLATIEKIQPDEKRKAVLNHKNKDGFTALNSAAFSASCCINSEKRKSYEEILKLLLLAGADPTIPNNRNYSAKTNYPSYSWNQLECQASGSCSHSRSQTKSHYKDNFSPRNQKKHQSRLRPNHAYTYAYS